MHDFVAEGEEVSFSKPLPPIQKKELNVIPSKPLTQTIPQRTIPSNLYQKSIYSKKNEPPKP
jgi:hypothetical protein